MALKVKNAFKIITASGGGTLVADADESFRIRGIYSKPSTNDTYVTVMVQGTTILKLRTVGKAGNHLPFSFIKTAQIYELIHAGLFEECLKRGFDLSIPVASGETLTVSRYAEAGLVVIRYDVYDAEDVKPSEPNGTTSKIRRYLHYFENAAAITSSPASLASSLMWSGGDQWPVNALAVPQNNVFRLYGILAAPSSRGNGSANKGYSTHLQLIQRNTVLFDEDRNGLPLRGYSSQTADAESYISEGSVMGPMTAENPAPGLFFEPALVFPEGETLTTNLVLSGAASGGIGASGVGVTFLLEHEYLG
jgi:hypothetical protein